MHKLFPSQQPNEKIYITARQHWFVLFKKVLIIAILFVAPALLQPLLNNTPTGFQGSEISALLTLLRDLYWSGLLLALFVVWSIWYLNLYIVSEERVVDIDQLGPLKRVVSELNLESIEDVSSETVGIFGNFLNYGNVYIQTAGASERFEFDSVPDPANVANIILTLYEAQGNSKK